MIYCQSTINVREDLIPKLAKAADTLKMKRSRVIEALLNKYIDKTKGGKKFRKKLQYQKIDKGVKSKKLGMFWRVDVYEKSLDVRKVYKMSVSFVITEAIEKYLDDVVRDILDIVKKEGTYNYNAYYFINADYYDNSFVQTIIWNHPGDEILWKVSNLEKN